MQSVTSAENGGTEKADFQVPTILYFLFYMQLCHLYIYYITILGQFHIREIKIENYEIELIYTRVWFFGAHQFTSSRTVSYFKM